MIEKAKLNCCAICKTKLKLHVTFSTDGKLYFLCTLHMKLSEILAEKFEVLLKTVAH